MDISNNSKVQELLDKLVLTAKNNDLDITEAQARTELEFALLEYYNDRHFTPTDEQPFETIYSGVIIQLAISSLAKIGAEGETSHSEGGVSRSYDSSSNYPLALTRKIIPLAKGVDDF